MHATGFIQLLSHFSFLFFITFPLFHFSRFLFGVSLPAFWPPPPPPSCVCLSVCVWVFALPLPIFSPTPSPDLLVFPVLSWSLCLSVYLYLMSQSLFLSDWISLSICVCVCLSSFSADCLPLSDISLPLLSSYLDISLCLFTPFSASLSVSSSCFVSGSWCPLLPSFCLSVPPTLFFFPSHFFFYFGVLFLLTFLFLFVSLSVTLTSLLYVIQSFSFHPSLSWHSAPFFYPCPRSLSLSCSSFTHIHTVQNFIVIQIFSLHWNQICTWH